MPKDDKSDRHGHRHDRDSRHSRGDDVKYKSTSDGRIKWREKDDKPKDAPKEDRQAKDDRRRATSSSADHRRHNDHQRDDRPHETNQRTRRSRSRSPQRYSDAYDVLKIDKFKPSGLLNEMNPVASGSKSTKEGVKEEPPKLKPNFGLSGKLAEDTNKFNGVIVKYNEPAEAKKPTRKWRLYPFKGEQSLDMIEINKQSAYLFGRDRKVVDVPIDHPSCSSQHAVIQFRSIPFERPDGSMSKKVRPYLIDLESSNGTFLNNSQIEPKKYYELMDKDSIKFGFSSREYILMHADYNEEDGASNK